MADMADAAGAGAGDGGGAAGTAFLPVPKAGFALTRGGPPLRLYDSYANAFQVRWARLDPLSSSYIAPM